MSIVHNCLQKEYYIFCEYDQYSPHKAILIPITNIQAQIFFKSKFLDKSLLIQKVYKKNENFDRIIGYLIQDQVDLTTQTANQIRYWLELIMRLHNHSCQEIDNEYLFYYVNDQNRTLSATQLQQKLLSMTEFKGNQISVKSCLMLIDHIYNPTQIKVLRFTVQTQLTTNDIHQLLSTDYRFSKVVVASNKDGKFAGYGYVWLNNSEDIDSLSSNIDYQFDQLKVKFAPT
jgi:hypothetical protein